MPEDGDKGRIYFDIDGQLLGPPDVRRPPTASSTSNTKSFQHEFSMIHYMLRSSKVLGTDAPKSEWPQFLEFSEACASEAARLVGNWDKIPNPAWLQDFREALRSSGKVEPSAIDEIGVSFVLTPKIYAYCFPKYRRIDVSAIARNHLRTVNLLIWTMASELYRSVGPLDTKLEQDIQQTVTISLASVAKEFVDLILPSLFSLYFNDVNYSLLPIVRVANEEVFLRSIRTALIQVEFLLAHEYAHLLFHDGKIASPELERQADTFAYELLLETEGFWKDDDGLFFASCRWFFLYLALDRIIGAVLSGYEVDWVDVPIRHREMWMYSRIRQIHFRSEEERDCQFWGDGLLFQAKAVLRERGAQWIRSAAQDFERKYCLPTQLL